MEDENDRAPLDTRVADYLDALYAEYDTDQAKLAEKRRLKEERTAPRKNHALPHATIITRAAAHNEGKFAESDVLTPNMSIPPRARRLYLISGQRNVDRTRLGGVMVEDDPAPMPHPIPITHQPANISEPLSASSDVVVEVGDHRGIILSPPPISSSHVPERTDTLVRVPSTASAVADPWSEYRTAVPSTNLIGHQSPSGSSSASSSGAGLAVPSAPVAKSCSHCSSTYSSNGWLNSRLRPGQKLCGACHVYEHKHRKARPLELQAKRKARNLSLRCRNCDTETRKGYVSEVRSGWKVCRKCHQYEQEYHKLRPRALFRK
ncbi:hypothetical protein DFH08DRAFT_80839 [Mycena albidolilacea]|uniref:GATA-type domain-containing protein n=1 Tax=Mycena albidolilacea TaxID=1033008 RepID=A0AAD7A8P2_9AGAR|nr:hypothetical protein DFH08DRAFT_80839 [Mycena albidolilacea]